MRQTLTLHVALAFSLMLVTPLMAQVAEKASQTGHDPQQGPSRGIVATGEPPLAGKRKLITDQLTQNFIPIGASGGGFTDSVAYQSGQTIVVDGNIHLQGPNSVPRLYLIYPAVPGYGGDVTGRMGATETFSVGFNSEAYFSGTQGTLSGRMLYFHDRLASTFRGVVDGQGTWWFGSSPTNFGLKVLAPAGSVVGMTIDSSGKVGIGGPADANYRLKVVGDAHFAGTVTGTYIKAHYQDVAEWVPATTDLTPGTVVILNRGRDNEVMASSAAYDTAVAGVVSTQPGISLGIEGEGKEQIATTGRVKVRVDARLKPIVVGDLLVTSDTPGTAMRSEPMSVNGRPFHQPGTIIGKALQPLEGGVGEILVLLSMQ